MPQRSRSRLIGALGASFLLVACKDDPEPGAEPDGDAMNGAAHAGSDDAAASTDAGRADALDGGPSEPQPFAPSSFSAEHEAEITKDCAETLQCLAQMGQELPDDPMQQCLHDSALALDQGGEPRQSSFLAKLERCRDLIVCDYYNCVLAASGG